jgi:hypothetical protein
VDLSSLFAGAVQAAPPTTAAATTAAAAPAADAAASGGDFASLVALALGEIGASPDAPAAADGVTAAARVRAEEGDEEPAEDEASPLDATVDVATLSVLIALATPQAIIPPAAAEPVGETPAVGTAAIDALDGQGSLDPMLPSATIVPSPSPSPSPSSSSSSSSEASPTRSADARPFAVEEAAPEAGPAPGVPARAGMPPSADVDTATPVAAPPTPSVTRPAAAPAGAPAGEAATAAAPAPTTPAETATPSQAVPSARPGDPAQPARSAQPGTAPSAPARPEGRRAATLRAALTAMAAADRQAEPQTSAAAPAATVPPSTAPVATPAVALGAQPEAAPAAARREPTPVVMATPVAALAPSRGDAGSAARNGGDEAQPDFAGTAFRHLAVPRSDATTPAPVADLVAAMTGPVTAPVPAAAGTPDPSVRPIELPSMARFEQTLASLDPDTRNMQAMVRTVRLFSGIAGASEARLQLAPEHLGPVALTVRVEQGAVSAHFRAETPAAQRWIETHQQELRNSLKEQGLDVRDVVVTTDPDARQDRRQDVPQPKPARARRSGTSGADQPRFEVLV